MAASSVPDALLVKTLAAPFTPCSQGSPLAYRFKPGGELVIIAADGRKLWFSAVEVSQARKALLDEARLHEKALAANRPRTPVRLAAQERSGAKAPFREVNKL